MTVSKLLLTAAIVLLAATRPAFAQRTDDNAVTTADDAFGKSVGDEQIGIYSEDNVRGFSAVAAGNVRIEGLYFDRQAGVTDRLRDGTTIRVGISAQGYPFPAPTGIADYELRKPGKDFVASFGATYGPFGGIGGEVDLVVPIDGERLGLVAGAGRYRERQPFGGVSPIKTYAVSLRYAEGSRFSLQPFWSRITVTGEESQSLIFTSGEFLPNRYPRGPFFGQRWAVFDGNLDTYGLVAKGKVGGFDLGLGVFRSHLAVKRDHIDLLFDTDQTGRVGDRIVVADQGNDFASTSGEFKASRAFVEGRRQHVINVSVRARSLTRLYGGSALIDLGPSQLGVADFRSEPTNTVFGAKSQDRVRQTTVGLGYQLRWRGIGEFSIGAQKTDYRKRVTTPTGSLPQSTDSPWLFSATGAVTVTPTLALYAGYTRGLEESDVAPSNAINFNEAPPAIRTQQYDFGARWGVSKGVTLVVGYFNVAKPYFNLDAASRFRQLGQVRNAGIEASLSGEVAHGLTIVAGATYLDAKLSGEEVQRGIIGVRPIGTFKLRTLANVNWTFPWHTPLTLTARFESTTDRTANTANTLVIPARSVTGLGARYRLVVGKTPVLIRTSVDNIFNKFGWNVGGSGFFVPNGSRRWSLSVAADV